MTGQACTKQEPSSRDQISQLRRDIPQIVGSFRLLHQISPRIVSLNLIQQLQQQLSQSYSNHSSQIKRLLADARERMDQSQKVMDHSVGSKTRSKEMSNKEHINIKDLAKKKSFVAKSFCQRDNTYSALQKEIELDQSPVHISLEQFQQILILVIKEAYGQLEEYLIKYCQLPIQPLELSLYQSMVSPIVKCRKIFEPSSCLTLFSIIQGQYGLVQMEPIRLKEAHALLQEIFFHLGKQLPPLSRPVNPQNKRQPRPSAYCSIEALVKIWNADMEGQFLNMCQRQTSLREIGKQLGRTYPQYVPLYTERTLKALLYKILRVSIRKFQHFIHVHQRVEEPQLVDLPDPRVKCLLNRTKTLDIRRMLLKLYQKEQYNKDEISTLIRSINNYFNQDENEKGPGGVNSVPMIRNCPPEDQYLNWAQHNLKDETKQPEPQIQNTLSQSVQQNKSFLLAFTQANLGRGEQKQDIDDWLEEEFR